MLLVFHTELYNFHESLFLLFSEIMKVFHSERCFDNDLTPSDTWQWPTAVLVGHSQRLTSGGDSVPANEDSQSCSRINKAGHWPFASLWDDLTSVEHYKCPVGLAHMWTCDAEFPDKTHDSCMRFSMLIVQICTADFNSSWWKFNKEAESPIYSNFLSLIWRFLPSKSWNRVRKTDIISWRSL